MLGISQLQLNYLAVASDLGKAFGWSSGLALMYMPLWVVLILAALLGFVGYGLQWLVIRQIIFLPYFAVFVLCLFAGCSICWFNTVCFVLCIRNFPAHRPLAISLTVAFNGLSAALYNLCTNAINPSSDTLYLLLNAVIPFITSFAALPPILLQTSIRPLPSDAVRRDSLIFLLLNFWAVLTGLYLLLFTSSDSRTARFLFSGAVFLLGLPLCIPGVVYAKAWFHRMVNSSFRLHETGFILVGVDDLELHKQLIITQDSSAMGNGDAQTINESLSGCETGGENRGCCGRVMEKDRLAILGEEHKARVLVSRVDFWLYYVAYFCGGTVGLVYSNNIGQIAESLGDGVKTTNLVTLYSSFSFFGRLLSAAPDYVRAKLYFARTGWMAIALLPTPIALFLLTGSGSFTILETGTALIGLSSGFIFAAAVSITSELFGPNSVGVNHNILITNIPIGSIFYGLLAALVYDDNVEPGSSAVCMGRQCYLLTFVCWGCFSLIGLASCSLLFFRTRHAYDGFEHSRRSTQLY